MTTVARTKPLSGIWILTYWPFSFYSHVHFSTFPVLRFLSPLVLHQIKFGTGFTVILDGISICHKYC